MSITSYHQQLNDRISRHFYGGIKKTWFGQVEGGENGFRSPRHIMDFGMNSDGIGTKMVVGLEQNLVGALGHDLVAMVCDDAIAMGGNPFMMTTTLDLGSPAFFNDDKMLESLISGLVEAANIVGVPVVGGESAILGNDVLGINAIWNATVCWRLMTPELIDGSKIKEGDTIIALKEEGCRSNGFTRLRVIMEGGYYPPEFYNELMMPSHIYTPTIRHLIENETKISGLIHVTGGGVSGRLKSYLNPYGFGAEIIDLHEPGEIFQKIISTNKLSLSSAYSEWCMGNGFFIITSEPEKVMETAIEHPCIDESWFKIAGNVVQGKQVAINLTTRLEY